MGGRQHGVDDADALVVMTDWREFNDYDLSELADLMADPVMIDLRNIFDGATALRSGFRRYESLGRPPIEKAVHRAAIMPPFASTQTLTAVAS